MADPTRGERRGPVAHIVHLVERIAAVMLGLVTILIFLSAIGRYVFALPVPDAFDLSRLTLAVAIMWGFASLGFRGNHIKVDLLALALPDRIRRWTDFAAWTVLAGFTLVLIWKIGGRVLSQIPGGESTMDLRLPHWPFLTAMLFGLALALVTTLIRLWRVGRHGEGLEPHETTTGSDRQSEVE